MKKRLLIELLALTSLVCLACGKDTGDAPTTSSSVQEINLSVDTTDSSGLEADDNQKDVSVSSSQVGGASICDETTELDYDHDYDDEIKVAVDDAVAVSKSFTDEFAKMDEIIDHIKSRRSQHETQYELNMASYYYYKVWDCELNNLWDRFTETVDDKTKDEFLAEQRKWIAIKDVAVEVILGPREDGGTIYPMTANIVLLEATQRRCYYLADALASYTGQAYDMPAKSLQGLYVDTQGTSDIYSYLSVQLIWESEIDADIKFYRLGILHGTIEDDDEAGHALFVSDDGNVKGNITYGWDGAKFEVTDVTGDSFLTVGQVYEFPFVF